MPSYWLAPLASLIALGGLTGSAVAAPPSKAEHAIAYRHAVYRVIAWNVGPMGAAVKGKIPYEAAEFASRAARVAALVPMLREGFPPDSYIAGKTHAKQAVWTNRAEFEELLKKLETRSAALADVAKGGDLVKIKPAFGDLVQTCDDCHKKFREKDED
jgi:cytochrome c556